MYRFRLTSSNGMSSSILALHKYTASKSSRSLGIYPPPALTVYSAQYRVAIDWLIIVFSRTEGT